MELYFQFGHGMKTITMDLSRDWGGATAILSPRDISPAQLIGWKKDFEKAKVHLLFDPQCYFPKSQHKGLQRYEYFNSSLITEMEMNISKQEEIIKQVLEYNEIAGCKEFIIPSVMLSYDEKWMSHWKRYSEKWIEASKKYITNKPLYLTLALPDTFLLQSEQVIESLIAEIGELDVDGYYIIAHPPKSQYLVDTPIWLSNIMQICAALKIYGKRVIMGYGNHQLLCLSATGIDAMATGTYLNVRSFSNKFQENNNSFQRRSVWYYYPAALSEYKIGFLDIAFNAGVLQQMKPSREMDNGYVDILFSGASPSATVFRETMAFKHYLNCVRVQIKNISKDTFEDTMTANEVLLETAIRRIEYMEKYGVYAQARSFKDMVDVNRAALQRLRLLRGFQLRQEWSNL
ncbi:MAG: hypothetical protein NC413_10670 [Muribaculum sp.]|nr:hypothetical protein [Muribaculum sp.]